MIASLDLFEAHLTVADLHAAIDFYRDIVGLRLAHVTPDGDAAFMWIGAAGEGMLGLWAAGPAPLRLTSHAAFRVSAADVMTAPQGLRAAGVTPLDFSGRPTDAPWSSRGCRRPRSISTIPTAICWSSSRCCRTGRSRNSECSRGACGTSCISPLRRTRLSERHDEQEPEQEIRRRRHRILGGDPGLRVNTITVDTWPNFSSMLGSINGRKRAGFDPITRNAHCQAIATERKP